MRVIFISIEEYERILATLDSKGYSKQDSVISHEGCLFQIKDMHSLLFAQLVPDTGLLRVLV